MAEQATLIPEILFPIIIAGITAAVGIIVEKRYVGKHTIVLNAINYILIFATVPIFSVNFGIASVFFIVGLYAIITDVRKKAKKGWIAFLLGSKTLGSVSLYIAFDQLDWIPTFKPLTNYLMGSAEVNDANLHLVSFLTILAIVHLLGLVAILFVWLKQKGYVRPYVKS